MRLSRLTLILLTLFSTRVVAQGLTLQQSYERALSYNQTVKISEEEINFAQARYRTLQGNFMPHIYFQANNLLQDNSYKAPESDASVGSTFTRFSRPEIKVNLTQNIFQGLKQFHQLSQGRDYKTKTRFDKANVERLLFRDVTVAFYTVVALERQIAANQQVIGIIRQTLGEIGKQVNLGKTRKGELLQQEADLSLLEADVERLRGDRRVAREGLSFLTGLDPLPELSWKAPNMDATKPVGYYTEFATRRPDYLSSQKDVSIAKKEIKVNEADLLPKVDLEANYYGYRVGFQENIHWDTLFSLDVPLFEWTNFTKVKEARIRSKQSEMRLEETRRVAVDEIRKAYETWVGSRNQFLKFSQAVQKAQQSYGLQMEDYRLSLMDSVDLFNSQRTLFTAIRQAQISESQTWIDWVNLQIVAGILP